MEDESDSEDDDLRKKELKNNRSALQTYTSLAEFEMLHLKPKMNELHEYRGLKTDSKPVFSKNPEIYFYDYGAISTRPISVFKQLKRRPATAATSKMAKKKEITFTAFNMLEPILLSNRPEKLRVNPMHYAYKPLRNCEMYGSASVSSILERPHTSAGIRTTKGHSQRTRKVLQDIAHAEQIAQGEDWEESKGECRADSKGFDSESIDPKKTELLRAIRDRCHQDRIRAKDLFKPFFEPIKGITVDGSGRGGSLSLERFLHALETKKIILPGAIDLSTLFQIFHRCDPNFSGPVSMPVLRKLISRDALKFSGKICDHFN